MKKEYEKAELELLYLNLEDVIVTSNDEVDFGGGDMGGN